MIRLLLLFFSINISSEILERADIQEFIDMAVESSDLSREEIIDYLKDAEPSNRAVQARSNQPEVKATWDDYLSKRVTARRIDNGVMFLKEHIDIFDSAEKDFGVSKFLRDFFGFPEIVSFNFLFSICHHSIFVNYISCRHY